MKIEKFRDLLKVKNKMVVDLSNMEIKERLKAICFLSGLTYQRGRLTKIACGQFLVKLGGMKIIREKDYQIGWACFLDDKNKVLLDFTKCMDQPNIMLSDIQSLCDNATILKAKNNAYFIGDYKYLSKAETEKYLKELFLEFENGVIKDRTYCCLNHYGKYANIAKTYQKLLEAIKLNDYQIVGVPTERYLSGRWDKENENEYVTQIMIPVKIN